MSAGEQEANNPELTIQEPPAHEWLTDVVDQWKRNAFRRALERRHAQSHEVVVESAHLVRTTRSS